MKKEKVIIIGSGAAGLTSALYTGRANLNPLVITGNQIGGQISITNEVENYPGFPNGASGAELVELMTKQVKKFGARFDYDEVQEVDFTKGSPFYIKTYQNEYQADSVIVTAGASHKELGIEGEKEFIGRGVSYCATCDGFFFKGKDVIVVGGGDSALEEGLFLTKFANSVKILHRRSKLRAGEVLKQRAESNNKISFLYNTEVLSIHGEQTVSKVITNNGKVKTDGVFIFIGHYPNSNIFKNQLQMDEYGYIITDELMRTSVDGVYAAGEIQDPIYRQIATSVGQGCSAAMQVEKWLSEKYV